MSTSRWPIPLGAVLVHLGIGSVYAWSTLNRPIIAALPPQPWWGSPPYTTFTAALVLLGLSAATMGPWVERVGPQVEVLARASGDHIVAVRQGSVLATAFHPEITGDRRVHKLFVDIVTGRA